MTILSKTVQPDLKYFGCFSDAFRINAHKLIYWGYRGSLLRIQHDSHEETTITGYISDSIKNRLRALNLPLWCEDFSVMENPPVEREGFEGKKRPVPDLVIEGRMQGRPEYVIEAKRMKKSDFGVNKYLGKDGLECFLNGKYAARYDEAAMLGYIQNNSPTQWQNEIQETMKNKADIHLEDVEIINDLPNEWVSVHDRESIKRSISIYHILLDFRKNGV